MNRRTFEGPMDWEYQNNRGPVDATSPFAQVSQRSFTNPSSFTSDSPSRSAAKPNNNNNNNNSNNPFANLGDRPTGLRPAPASPSKQMFPRPPSTSLFHAPGVKSFPAAPFRNPSFTTPQKRTEELFSEWSGTEESPAMQSDVSMIGGEDTPEVERYDDEYSHATITPASMVNRKLFNERKQRAEIPGTPDSISSSNYQTERPGSSRPTSSHAPGRGEVPRGRLDYIFGRRDRIRKRKRQQGDKDVGSVRSRFHGENSSDESEDDSDVSEWAIDAGNDKAGPRRAKGRRGQWSANNGSEPRRGILGTLFTAIHDHPNVPVILSWWVQLGMNVFFMAVVMWFVWGGISMMRADISHAADAARSRLLAQMNECAHDYTKNRCAPKSERLPALNIMCNEWEVCMNQDPSSVMKMQVSAKNVAEIINEFVGVMSFKAWGFILSAMLAVILASNMGFSRFRDSALINEHKPNVPGPQTYASQPAGAPTHSLPPSQDPNQAYIWAPIGQTPRHIRREYMLQPDTPTDTDCSPEAPRAAIMAPPKTPSSRRSPSKGGQEREHSPSKLGRSPSKFSHTPSKISRSPSKFSHTPSNMSRSPSKGY